MTSEVLTCRPGESVQSLMNTMTEQRIRHLPVVDDFGRLAGLVSIGDVGEVTHLPDRVRARSVGGLRLTQLRRVRLLRA